MMLHKHEWKRKTYEHNVYDFHCIHCDEWMPPEEIERRLNATEHLPPESIQYLIDLFSEEPPIENLTAYIGFMTE